MHIDHSKLIELLVETSGIEKEKIESQLADLVEEINEAIEEGEAYEVDGFGVFSAIGQNVVFIPADELATEINYKYVGMEAIEMDDTSETVDEPDAQDEEDPFAGLLDDEPVTASTAEQEPRDEEDESPFDLEDEAQNETDDEIEEKPGPDKWGIDTYKDDADETMFSGLLGDAPNEKSEQEEEHFKAVFDQEDEGDDDLERISEIERELSGETDDDEESKSEEDDTDPFAALAEEEDEQDDEEEDLEKVLGSAISDDDEDEDLEEALSSSINEESEEDEVEPVPVIKNITSEAPEKKKESEKEKKRKPFKRPQKANKTGSQSALLLIVIIIILLGGGIYGLGYYGFVNIPGITPAEVPSTAQTTPPAPEPEDTGSLQDQDQNASSQNTDTETAANELNPTETPDQDSEQSIADTEQGAETQVSETQEVVEQAPTGEVSYGLTGSISDAANNGYTIVLYSLTNEDNARAKVSELSDQGYRAILASIPHQQYGTLWRVSIGQFETMRNAALAAQDLDDSYTDNYFVTQIQ